MTRVETTLEERMARLKLSAAVALPIVAAVLAAAALELTEWF